MFQTVFGKLGHEGFQGCLHVSDWGTFLIEADREIALSWSFPRGIHIQVSIQELS